MLQLKELKLENFRQFKKETYSFDNSATVITGDNTKGKSTLLEAIYFLCNGHSPWSSDLSDLLSYNDNQYFRIEGKFRSFESKNNTTINEIEGFCKNNDCDEFTVAIFYDGFRSKITYNGKGISRKKLNGKISCLLFSPEQIELLMVSPSKRREFMDNIATLTDLDYGEIHSTYEKILRQRNAYLKKMSKRFYDTGVFNENDSQLQYWTEQLANYSAKLMSRRNILLKNLCDNDLGIIIEYKPSLTLNLFEDLADEKELIRIHLQELLQKIRADIAVGHSRIGAHRDDWKILTDKDIKRFGSRGEKRMAIGKMIFKAEQLLKDAVGYPPILLLDDISSELDDKNIVRLLSAEIIKQQQLIITSINHNPERILENFPNAKLIRLE